MKNFLLFLIFVIIISCSKNKENVRVEKEVKFQKTKFDLRNRYIDSLVVKINPDKKYKYWAYIYRNQNSIEDKFEILAQGGDTVNRKLIDSKILEPGFYQGGHPNFVCSYVAIVENNKIKYLTTEEQFKTFLGEIDNLEESILLAKTYGYYLDTEIQGNAYRIKNNTYELHLLKYYDFPRQKESVEIQINKQGFMKAKSLGIYCKGNCY